MRIGLNAIERYVLGQTLIAVLGAMAILSSVILLIDFVDVGGRIELSFTETAGLVAMKSPAVILVVLPFMLLFGTLAAFVGLNRRSELVAMRAAGVSAWRFIMPAAITAFLFGVATVTALDPLTGALSSRFERALAAKSAGEGRPAPSDVWLRQGDDSTQTVIHARGMQSDGGSVRLENPAFFVFNLNQGRGMTFERRLEAESAVLEVGAWRLSTVKEAVPGAEVNEHAEMSFPTLIADGRDIEAINEPQSIPLTALPRFIRQTEQAGFSSLGYRLRLQQLLATPLLFAAMSILAAAFSLKLMRSGGLAVLATSGVALGFLFFFLNEFASALGAAGTIPVYAAAWAPPLLALLSGLTLLCYTEDG